MAPPAVLSIAGSDSGGGAGIQADLKAFARCGVHGMTAITALTAQNTTGVTGIHPVPPEFIVEQVRAVHADIGVDAVKIGMLGTAEIVRAVREALAIVGEVPIVIDPVMVSESGAVLLDDAARRAIVQRAAAVGDRDHAEPAGGARARGGRRAAERRRAGGVGAHRGDAGDDVRDLARALHDLGPQAVVITGGHRDEIVDVFFDGHDFHSLTGERYPDGAAHGSGCTHSSALAAHLALGHTPLQAARARAGHRLRGRRARPAPHRPGSGTGGRAEHLRPWPDGTSAWRDRTRKGHPSARDIMRA